MQKLDMCIFEKLIEKNITGNELDLLLYICRYQDEFGKIYGIYYKDAVNELKISNQGFYEALRGLESKNIIEVEKGIKDYNIVVVKNNAADTNNFAHGYISVMHPVFTKSNFRMLPVKAKILLINLVREESLRRKEVSKTSEKAANSQRYKRINFIEKFTKLLQVKSRSVIDYIKLIKEFVTFSLKNGMYYITFKKNGMKEDMDYNTFINSKTENNELRLHQVRYALRRNRIKTTSGTERKLVKKLSIFTKYIFSKENFDFSKVLYHALKENNSSIKDKYKWNRNIKLGIVEKYLIEAAEVPEWAIPKFNYR